MKENIIVYTGIRTNNLKGFNFEIPKGSFWGITGPSGSGKSSLAYGTIYAIAQFEWEKISNYPASVYLNFNVKAYKNIIPAVALKQENFNSNPRSTIATFLRIDRVFKLLFACVGKVSPSYFSFNNPHNACPYCEGLGTIDTINISQLIDWNKSIQEKPFQIWSKDYHQNLLERYANINGIPTHIPISLLPKDTIQQLLRGQSDEKIAVTYKTKGKSKTHHFFFNGLLNEIDVLKNDKKHISSFNKLDNICCHQTCPHCHGTRFNDEIISIRYRGKSIGDFYMMEIDELEQFLIEAIEKERNYDIRRFLLSIECTAKSIIDGDLGYLQFNRSIPSLSGGELQRIRLINILSSQINDMMYIIDEPSACLHVSEYDSLIRGIESLKKKGNTILMIEHNNYFLDKAEKVIYMGPKSGDDGGNIVDPYFDKKENTDFKHNELRTFVKYTNITDNNLHNVSITIPLYCITGIYGPSGSGKTTLIRNIALKGDKIELISQKPLRGSKASTIASYSELLDKIQKEFAENNKVDASYFSFNEKKGQCPMCKGKGQISYEIDFGRTKINVVCDECQGKRYNPIALSYRLQGYSIFDILNLSIDTLSNLQIFKNVSIKNQLSNLRKLGLGHLSLFRTTDTLSGGEAQRLKLIKFLGKKYKDRIFIFDEPLKGLNSNDASGLLKLFQEICNQKGTVIFIEHNVLGFKACDYVIEIGPGKGKNGGKIVFEGDMESFQKSFNYNKYKIYNYEEM